MSAVPRPGAHWVPDTWERRADPGLVHSRWPTAWSHASGPGDKPQCVISPTKDFVKTHSVINPEIAIVKKWVGLCGYCLTQESAFSGWVALPKGHWSPPKHLADAPALTNPPS